MKFIQTIFGGGDDLQPIMQELNMVFLMIYLQILFYFIYKYILVLKTNNLGARQSKIDS